MLFQALVGISSPESQRFAPSRFHACSQQGRHPLFRCAMLANPGRGTLPLHLAEAASYGSFGGHSRTHGSPKPATVEKIYLALIIKKMGK
jgi:hypothetical protein